MCMSGGGGGGNSQYQQLVQQQQFQVQQQQQQELSDKQIKAQQDIAAQQAAFNQQQFDYQKDQAAQQQQQVQAQADRQSTYDTGRAQLLGEGTNQIEQAFSKFTPDYFDKYAADYMAPVQSQLAQQRSLADKQMMFGLARRGAVNSQSRANETGLLQETEGRTLADQTQQAQQAAAQLRSNVAGAKQNLLGQVTAAESIGSPIAAGTLGDVNSALQTQRNAVSGIANNAGDVTASLQAQPTVSTLGDIFGGVLSGAGSYLGGVQANRANQAYSSGLRGASPFGKVT
jgi:multidrug efflux pump subunit AcrA (membrane-fusion protein)